jgi:hypothetical protein
MKKLFFIFLLAVIIIPYACTKRYEEDPWTMHFVRMRKRITGEWHMKKILIDEQEFSHLIEMENDTFFSVYEFKEFTKKKNGGDVVMKTKNKKYLQEYIYFHLNKSETNNNSIYFTGNNTGLTLGPINYFEPARIDSTFDYGSQTNYIIIGFWYEWEIKKLTRKQMHLSIYVDFKHYELFFEK